MVRVRGKGTDEPENVVVSTGETVMGGLPCLIPRRLFWQVLICALQNLLTVGTNGIECMMDVCMDRAPGAQAIRHSSRWIQQLTLTQAGVAGLAHGLAGIGAGRRGRGGGVPGVTGQASVDANVLVRSGLRGVRAREGQQCCQAQEQLFAGAEHDCCVGRPCWMPAITPV